MLICEFVAQEIILKCCSNKWEASLQLYPTKEKETLKRRCPIFITRTWAVNQKSSLSRIHFPRKFWEEQDVWGNFLAIRKFEVEYFSPARQGAHQRTSTLFFWTKTFELHESPSFGIIYFGHDYQIQVLSWFARVFQAEEIGLALMSNLGRGGQKSTWLKTYPQPNNGFQTMDIHMGIGIFYPHYTLEMFNGHVIWICSDLTSEGFD